jgi:ELWxxDGT repeat protein
MVPRGDRCNRQRRFHRALTDALEPRTLLSVSLVKDINSNTNSSSPANFLPLNGKVLFTAYTPQTGTELFITDSTAGGTRLVLDIIKSGTTSSTPPVNGEINGDDYFWIDSHIHSQDAPL